MKEAISQRKFSIAQNDPCLNLRLINLGREMSPRSHAKTISRFLIFLCCAKPSQFFAQKMQLILFR